MFATDGFAYPLAFHTAKNRTKRTVAQKEMRFTMSHTLSYQSCKSGWVCRIGLGFKFAKMLRDDLGPAYKTFP